MMGVMASELDIRGALKHVLDPEIGVNIVDLGLVYRIEVEGTRALVVMTMTSPACPLVDYLKELVTSAIPLGLCRAGCRRDLATAALAVRGDDDRRRAGVGVPATRSGWPARRSTASCSGGWRSWS